MTGRTAYQVFERYMNDPKILSDGALYVGQNYFWESAGYWWSVYKPNSANDDRYNLNKKCDEGASVEAITRIIVGGIEKSSLAKRQDAYNYYKITIK